MPRTRTQRPEGFMSGAPIRFLAPHRTDYGQTAAIGQIGLIYSVDTFSGNVSVYTGGTTVDGGDFTHFPRVPYDDIALIPRIIEGTPADNRKDRRNLRAKLTKSLDAYKSIENPTVAVRSIIEELEGALSL